MNILTRAKQFYAAHVTCEEKIYFGLMGLLCVLSTLYITLNALFFHYTGDLYIPIKWMALIPFFFALLIFALYAKNLSPRAAFATRGFSIYFFTYIAATYLTTGIQFTPFPLIDNHLIAFDRLIGFHSIAALQWTHAHPMIKKIFHVCYMSLGFQMFIIPLVLAIWMDKRGLDTYLLAALVSYTIGTTVYYFFPTAGLTYIFHTPLLGVEQHDTFLKFYDVHHRIPLTTYQGGMIAFPSFHVTWATLLTLACRYKKVLFYPMIVLNLIVITSTFMLGWHYLTDVFAAFVLVAISLSIVSAIRKRYFSD